MILQAGGHPLQNPLRPFINLWRCYALSHGMAFILETDPGWVGLLPELAGKRPHWTHSIHGTGIFPYIYHKRQANVGKYTIVPWDDWYGKVSLLNSQASCDFWNYPFHHPGLTQTSPHSKPGKAPAANWMRWFAAERFLYFYEALLKLDLTLDQDGPVGGGRSLMRRICPKSWFSIFKM